MNNLLPIMFATADSCTGADFGLQLILNVESYESVDFMGDSNTGIKVGTITAFT
jgi:hypothetical protein